MNANPQTPDILGKIADRHINSVDKHYRMHAGASTRLNGLGHGALELETTIDRRRRPVSVAQLIQNVARSWHRNPELSSCHNCHVRVHQSAGPTGFSIPARQFRNAGRLDPEGLAKAVEEMLQRMRLAAALPAPLVAEFPIPLDERGGRPVTCTRTPTGGN